MSTARSGTQVLPEASKMDMSGETIEWMIQFMETDGSAKWVNAHAPVLFDALPG
ncbi:hypothetical protein [Palleronia sp. THAF1]|uniref:hypothetical protein n=1 Tax=Palleronia sp. THAF1 TaxID=2587842 RepID=UPI0020C7BFCF|nr:hypothetical protein [Palleronia sp. THAF1]